MLDVMLSQDDSRILGTAPSLLSETDAAGDCAGVVCTVVDWSMARVKRDGCKLGGGVEEREDAWRRHGAGASGSAGGGVTGGDEWLLAPSGAGSAPPSNSALWPSTCILSS